MALRDWLNIDFEFFHFLRPRWLWLFVPLALAVTITLVADHSKKGWQRVIARHLRPYMIGKGSGWGMAGPLILYSLAASLMVLAVAGPTWKKVEVPGAKREAILLIGLDLSLSMMVEDVPPNRLERAKFKIRDLLDADPGSKVGLFVFSGTAHPVVTPCRDYSIVAYQLASLSPAVMPVQGTDLRQAIDLADTILSRTQAPSTLLLLTDNIAPEDAPILTDFVNRAHHKLELMTFATPQGGHIPRDGRGNFFKESGEYVTSRLDQDVLFQLQSNPDIHVNPLTLDKTDVSNVAKQVKDHLVFTSKGEDSEEEWQEMGYSLLSMVAIIYVFWFRKGWVIQWCVLIMISSCGKKVQSWEDLWYTVDYQGQRSVEQGQYERAAEKFRSLPHKGAAYYKAGDYEAAIQVFSQDTTAVSMFNLGLAYAANGEHELAEEALTFAAELDPENSNIQRALQNNRKVIQQIDSLRRINPDSAVTLKEKEEKGELIERQAKGKDEELTSDTEVEQLPEDGERVTDEVSTAMRTAEELERPPEDFQPQAGESAQNVLLREISADPSEFLRRRFQLQYEKYYAEKPKPEKPW